MAIEFKDLLQAAATLTAAKITARSGGRPPVEGAPLPGVAEDFAASCREIRRGIEILGAGESAASLAALNKFGGM